MHGDAAQGCIQRIDPDVCADIPKYVTPVKAVDPFDSLRLLGEQRAGAPFGYGARTEEL